MFDAARVEAPDRIAREAWRGTEVQFARQGPLDRAWAVLEARALAGLTVSRGRACRRIVAAVERAAGGLDQLDDQALAARARAAGRAALRTDPARLDAAAPLLAIIREAAERTLGLRHYHVQLMGGLAMLRGQLAEMQTGEGKTLTATLAAGAMALSGRPVHVVTVNDYLAERDAREMGPVYRALGLSVGLVKQGMEPDERQRAYGADVTYCTNKELAFDYLRDRLNPATGAGRHARRANAIHDRLAGGHGGGTLLRGLAFALIDEADSVLIDEARTPLILSSQGPANFDEDLLVAAARAVEQLGPRDYHVNLAERRIELTPAGSDRLEHDAGSGLLANRIVREELAVKALSARHLFVRDQHYLVREGKIEIIDEYTGRVMADRFWTDGLHQMIELKEGVELSRGRITLARTTYQRFFRRYDRIAGMSGTAREVARELWQTYRLAVATIPTNRPVRRQTRRARIFRRADDKWDAIAAETGRLAARGVPVLIGTRSVAASKIASEALDGRGVRHTTLSAAQDAEEAEIIARAGQPGRVTVATNMAGRGADIKLGEGVAAFGGLHVIMSENHDSRRIDRQLAGRAGRQGDPGTFRAYLSLEDPLLADDPSLVLGWIAGLSALTGGALGRYALDYAQSRAEARHGRMRRDLLRQDEVFNDAMSFAGEPD